LRLLLLLTHAGLFRNFDSTLRELVERGHDVHLSLDSDRYPSAALDALVEAHDNLTVGFTPAVAADRWAALGRGVRAASDYVRYLDPRYAGAPKLRARARRQVPAWLRWTLREGAEAARTDRRLRRVEAALPLSAPALAYVRERRPDLVAVSPLFGSPAQLETLRAARALGVPTCLPVASWDNLTNKGLIREIPDAVLVWNEAQRDEAVALHNVPRARVTVTGAQNFDEWFARGPSTTYEEFAARLGFDPARPYLLYLGSSSFIAPEEAPFAVDWLAAVRAHPELAEAGVLFRPHPQNARQWALPELLEDPRAAIYPPPELAPQQTGRADWSREDFYDSLYHAAAVIGVNTTAMIEGAVLGRPVYTMLAPRFADTQAGTLHFEHLRTVGGGLLHLSERFDEHTEQLADAVRRRGEPSERSRNFVAAFVRPHGLDQPATPLVVNALEAAVALERAPAAAPRRSRAYEPLAAVAFAADRAAARRKRKRRKPGRRRRMLTRRIRAVLAGR
jgi:hypothetical protein